MISRLRSIYLKSRVINVRHHLPATMVALVNSDYGQHDDNFMFKEHYHYWESRFLNFAVKNWKVDTSKWTPSEKELFQEGVEVLSQFDALENFVTGVGNMKNEALTIYQEISRDISTPTILGRDMKSSQQVIEELSNFLHRYKELLDQIEDADWKRKVEGEIGYYLHMIYNQHCLQDNTGLFENLNLQEFFK